MVANLQDSLRPPTSNTAQPQHLLLYRDLIGVHLLQACISYRRASYRCASLINMHLIQVHRVKLTAGVLTAEIDCPEASRCRSSVKGLVCKRSVATTSLKWTLPYHICDTIKSRGAAIHHKPCQSSHPPLVMITPTPGWASVIAPAVIFAEGQGYKSHLIC